ncbi:MAG: hypothetical protein KKA64_03655 [Nanoarchaeota archaeon]|nr:hypothetical protein [Nanoarchaeota archaeon]
MSEYKIDKFHTAYDGIDKSLKFLSEGGMTYDIRKFYQDKSKEELEMIKENRLMPVIYTKA